MQKTNAMRFLDKNKIPYNTYSYENKDGKIDGVAVAEKIGKGVECVFKTLVAQGQSRELYVFVIPVNDELDLKKAAKVAGEKKIEMIHVKDINKHTGYIRGGCSPLAMKKLYRTFIDISAEELANMIFSGGKIGVQIEVKPKAIADSIGGRFEELKLKV
ncbi:Cys-tRNA(Pro) deacylase [Clostridium vincentii]|uniref:Cys-tRNA(Pro)/Cys-tRNA(Cys) deacylase n=1 Tax=Clostridium vincentii TaxID=52704 RepID=A0A2T0BCL3_9CLOT|nr:Cys-tRNA(Pro) deacylase [Clostridium vincentii]PRR81585.1 Cys-tRNA(Pro)/Cys-tRNA(Cys) deacylase YbaK [Clostridium vincentii]